jgi:hypothetical protein
MECLGMKYGKSRASEQLIPLKCDFHVHYIELMPDNPEHMIDAYYELKYDCIALTEHGVHMDYELQQQLIRYANDKYGDKLLVIFGEEMTFWDDYDRGFNGGDILGLFTHSPMGYEKHNQPERIVQAIREQGGLVISAHDTRSNLKTQTDGIWGIRKKLSLDGFEIVNANGIADTGDAGGLTHPEEAVKEGYICLANTDSHNIKQLQDNKHIYTIVYSKERSLKAMQEALQLRQTVAVYGERCFGKPEWVEQFRISSNKI